jgi:hypothetical protein
MLDVEMRRPVLDWDPPPNVPTPAEIELAEELLHRLEARYFCGNGAALEPSSVPG